MKILGLEVRRQAPAQRVKDTAAAGVMGADDSAMLHTWLYSNDPNPLFRYPLTRYQIFDEMRYSDPSVRAALLMRKLPARAAKWRVDPCSDSPLDKLVADACAWQLGIGEWEDGPLVDTWGEVLGQAQLKIDLGCFFEEKIWGREAFTFTDKDGDDHLMFAVQRLAPRPPRTVFMLETEPETGMISRFEQNLPGSKPIPPQKLISHATERENGQWWGTSLLRAMYGPWKLKRELMISAGIGWDRFAAGIPVATYQDASYKAEAGRIARDVRGHERAWVALEQDKISLDLLNGSGTLADPVPLLSFYCTQIADAALESFTSLGTSQHGSRAVADVLVEPFWQSVSAETEQIASTYRKRLLRDFVTVNFGEAVPTPYLKPGRIGTRDIAILCQALYDASNAGLDFKDVETQDAIREILELPNLPDDYEPPAEGEGLPPSGFPDGVLPVPPVLVPKPAVPAA